MKLEATKTALKIGDQDIFWSQINSTRIEEIYDEEIAAKNLVSEKLAETVREKAEEKYQHLLALRDHLVLDYRVLKEVSFANRLIWAGLFMWPVYELVYMPADIYAKAMLFGFSFLGLVWAAFRPSKTLAKEKSPILTTKDYRARVAYDALPHDLHMKLIEEPDLTIRSAEQLASHELLAKTIKDTWKNPYSYRLYISTSSGEVSTIATHTRPLLEHVQESIAKSIEASNPAPFHVHFNKEGDVINQTFGDVAVTVENTFNIDNATNYYKTENHGFTAEQVQTIVDSIVPGIKSLESAIDAHKAQSAEASAEIKELSEAIEGIKTCLASAPTNEDERSKVRKCFDGFKAAIDNCARIESLSDLSEVAMETLKTVGGALLQGAA